jgi:hypothetical protein
MFLAASTDRWHWSEDVFPPVGFCVYALVRDGLRVPPFDQHPEGDRSLSERGCDADGWSKWLTAVIAQSGRLAEAATALAGGRDRTEMRANVAEAAEVLRQPASFCPGTAELRVRLGEFWADYEPQGEAWKRSLTTGKRHDWLAPRHERWLWRALLPFHGRPSTLSIFLVDYPVPVVMTVPPTTGVIARDRFDRDGYSYAHQVLAAAQELSRPE